MCNSANNAMIDGAMGRNISGPIITFASQCMELERTAYSAIRE